MSFNRNSLPHCSTPKAHLNRKRKSLHGIISPHGIKQPEPTEDSLLDINEDEAEKKAHRRSIALQSFQKTPGVLSSPSQKRLTPLATARLTQEQLKQHYADCIKLSAENKINSKNAFGLHLLEYIDTILQDKSDNFQVFGCTIDAGAKIYAGRVDAVHNDILKLLGTIGNTIADNEQDQDDEAVNEEGPNKKKEKKKKKIKLCAGRTIEKNIANIRNTTYDLSFDIDPLIQITTRQSDEQCTASLISYNVFLKHDSLQFDSTSVYHTRSDESPDVQMPSIDVGSLKGLIPGLMNTNRTICPTFEGFRFNNWKCTEEKSFYEERASQSTQESLNLVQEPFVPGMDEMDDVVEDFGAECASSGDEGVIGSEQPDREGTAQKLTIDDLTMALEPTEYGYFNPRLVQMWAGPGHWKFKPVNAKPEVAKKERKKKVLVVQTFDTAPDDLMKHIIKSRARTTLADETIRSNKTSSNTLPLDIHYLESDLRKLSMLLLWRGKMAPNSDKIVSSGEASAKDGWYDYNNQHDLSNYCPNQPEDDDDDDIGAGEIGFDPTPFSATPIGGLELIDAAPKIERININYAKQAKKIDIKKLKSVMWRNISGSSGINANENVSENIRPVTDEACKHGSVKFSDIYRKIPSQVSSLMAENLSVPIAFACLLHLANEHGLQLKDDVMLNEVDIIIPDVT